MTALTITAASVLKGANANTEAGLAGATITAGQVVYRDASDGKYKLADADSATAAIRQPRGIALNGASDGQPLTILKSGDVTIGATLTPGEVYYLSATPGSICQVGDLGSGDYACSVGIAKSASVLAVAFNYSGAAL